MQIQAVSQNGALVQLGEEELLLISNALNEVCHALDINEFATRMGADQAAAERLLTTVGALVDQIEAAKALPSSGNR